MANALYGKGRNKFLKGDLDWEAGTGPTGIKVSLIDISKYTVDIDVDEFYSDVAGTAGTGPAVIAEGLIEGRIGALGIADGNDITFFSVPTGPTGSVLIIRKDTGDPETSPLIAYIDDALGLPVAPNGTDIVIQWDNGINKIFKL